MTPAAARARLEALGWRLERVSPEVYGCAQGGWRARKGRFVRGGYRVEHVVEQVLEHEAWEARRMQPYYHDEAAGITIYQGDCRTILPLLTERPRLVLADPPYGVNENTKRASSGRGCRPDVECRAYDYPPVAGDDEPFNPAHLLALQVSTILWGANHYADKLPPAASWFVWDKRAGTTPDDNADCELAWTNLGGPARLYTHLWRGMIKASERDQRRLHPTQKPVALMRWCLQRAGLKAGDLVLDPYMGSGPVLRACMDLGLRCIGIELEADYCEVAVRRLAQSVLDLSAA